MQSNKKGLAGDEKRQDLFLLLSIILRFYSSLLQTLFNAVSHML